MKYPEWAPPILVEKHKSLVDSKLPERKSKVPDPGSRIIDLAIMRNDVEMKHRSISEESTENYRQLFYRMSFGLPDKESTALLERLITDIRMEGVWKALAKRIDIDFEFYQFFNACEKGITGWRGNIKQTASERKAFYQEIRDTATKLFSLINKSDQFDFYSIDNLVDKKKIKWLLEVLDAPIDVSYAQFSLAEITPSIDKVLIDISEKATQYGEKESPVKKPNSPNAEIHYFIRSLSHYFSEKYRKPLHEVVAITAGVIFDKQDIEADHVKKLVNRQRV